MHYKEFSEFYTVVIEKYIDELEAQSKMYGNCLKVNKSKIDKIYKDYQKKRDELKNLYMEKDINALDGHKVAACFMYSILKNRIFRVNRLIPDLPHHMLMANEYLAVFTAINIVDMYGRFEKKNDDFTIIIPKTYHDSNADESDFISNCCKQLYYIKNKKHFDILAYSTILFLLEKYTDAVRAKKL